MDSIKRCLLPLLLSLALLCACAPAAPDNSPGVSPSGPAPSQVQAYLSPSPSPNGTAPSELQPGVSPTPAAALPEPSPSQSAPVLSQTASAPLASSCTAPESPVPDAAEEEPVEVVVYVTRTGEKYHADGCQYLSRSCIPISLDDAKAGGYTPCSKCHPPR